MEIQQTEDTTLVTAQVGATTENPTGETTPASPKEMAEETVRIAKHMAKGENMLLEREIWAYMNALTAPGVDENQKYQLKKSMARAIQFGVNFMGLVPGETPIVELRNHGRLAKIENNLARAIVKLAEVNTLVMADNMAKAEEAQEKAFAASQAKAAAEETTVQEGQ